MFWLPIKIDAILTIEMVPGDFVLVVVVVRIKVGLKSNSLLYYIQNSLLCNDTGLGNRWHMKVLKQKNFHVFKFHRKFRARWVPQTLGIMVWKLWKHVCNHQRKGNRDARSLVYCCVCQGNWPTSFWGFSYLHSYLAFGELGLQPCITMSF